ncbi:hypothetical protein E4U13_003056 [Claviceps humidiphila]|uniref:Uncharacterized protein n=1 Tax=Claviceps humidiphila TaxID=1294629 RepID=A0A9P7Q3F3_9HYPO|nr:hypothetical protein E4U13_003056 [Claviceps humidiphila]
MSETTAGLKILNVSVPTTTTSTNNIVMADWCDLALGNPLDEQPDFDGERADSVGSQTPPSASQSARSLKSPRVHRNIEDLWPVDFQWTCQWTCQWTSSGRASGLASGLPVDFQWTCHFGGGSEASFRSQMDKF